MQARRRRAFETYGRLCTYCQQPADTIDHVVPKSAGGADNDSNVVPACRECNQKKGRASVLFFLGKYNCKSKAWNSRKELLLRHDVQSNLPHRAHNSDSKNNNSEESD